MIRFTTAALALSACLTAPMLAQNSSTTTQTPMQDQQSMPSQTTSPNSNRMMAPDKSNLATADLSGQAIYTEKGKKIGTVSSMNTGANGERSAAVLMDRYLGMGGQTVLIPVSSLTARASGGYNTSLSSTEIKALPKADTGKMQ